MSIKIEKPVQLSSLNPPLFVQSYMPKYLGQNPTTFQHPYSIKKNINYQKQIIKHQNEQSDLNNSLKYIEMLNSAKNYIKPANLNVSEYQTAAMKKSRNVYCFPDGCSKSYESMSYVKVMCDNTSCNESGWMHTQCMNEIAIVKNSDALNRSKNIISNFKIKCNCGNGILHQEDFFRDFDKESVCSIKSGSQNSSHMSKSLPKIFERNVIHNQNGVEIMPVLTSKIQSVSFDTFPNNMNDKFSFTDKMIRNINSNVSSSNLMSCPINQHVETNHLVIQNDHNTQKYGPSLVANLNDQNLIGSTTGNYLINNQHLINTNLSNTVSNSNISSSIWPSANTAFSFGYQTPYSTINSNYIPTNMNNSSKIYNAGTSIHPLTSNPIPLSVNFALNRTTDSESKIISQCNQPASNFKLVQGGNNFHGQKSCNFVENHEIHKKTLSSHSNDTNDIDTKPIHSHGKKNHKTSQELNANAQQAAVGHMFKQRRNLIGFYKLPRAVKNPYNIKSEDDGTFGTDDLRNFVLTTLSINKLIKLNCCLCADVLDIYDTHPLIDGVIFLSPRLISPIQELHHLPYYHAKQFSINAICIKCVYADKEFIHCKMCNSPWSGKRLVLGSIYSFDVFAAQVCCDRRFLCRDCGNSSMSTPLNIKWYSEFSKKLPCDKCGKVDFHFVNCLNVIYDGVKVTSLLVS